jgi:hypothetical protein
VRVIAFVEAFSCSTGDRARMSTPQETGAKTRVKNQKYVSIALVLGHMTNQAFL